MTDTSTAPAKKPAAAAKKKVPAKKAAVGRAKFSDDAKIKLLAKENPRRKGTEAYERFAKFKDGMTVGEFVKACERHPNWNARGTILASVKRGQISVKE